MKYSGFRCDAKRHVLTFSTQGQRQVTTCCTCAVTSRKKCHVFGCRRQAGDVCCLKCLLRKTGKQRCKNPGVLGVPSVDRGIWGWECHSLIYRVLALREERMLRFVKDWLRLIRSCHKQRWRSFTERFAARMIMPEKMSKVHARSHEIKKKPLRVRTTKTLWLPTWKTNYNAEKCASDVKKKLRIVVNRISKVSQITSNCIKKILDEATRIVNMFLISWFFCFFLLCLISLLVNGTISYCGIKPE